MKSLKEYSVDLTFFGGTWADMDVWIRKRSCSYDLILTSETIYRPSNLKSLTSLLRSSSTLYEIESEVDAHPSTGELVDLSLRNANPAISSVCLVAAKVIYFGVGGGIDGFERAIEEMGGRTKTVYERKAGVSRRILQVTWTQNDSG
jgi:protein-histidine N-methyltransferase